VTGHKKLIKECQLPDSVLSPKLPRSSQEKLGVVLAVLAPTALSDWLEEAGGDTVVLRLPRPERAWVLGKLLSPGSHEIGDSRDESAKPWPEYSTNLFWSEATADTRWLEDQAKRLNFDDAFGLGQRLLGHPLGAGAEWGLFVTMPVYARLNPPKVVNQHVRVTGRAHTDFGQLNLEAVVLGKPQRSSYRPEVIHNVPTVPIKVGQPGADGIGELNREFDLPPLSGGISLRLVLFLKGARRINLTKITQPLPSSDPLFRSFAEFVPVEELDRYLDALAAGNKATRGTLTKIKATQHKLEIVTGWLLSLCESTILSLTPYDALTADSSHIGGADLLVRLHSGQIALVGCTEATAGEAERNKALAVRAALCERLGIEDGSFRIVLVSGAPAQGGTYKDVTVVGSDKLMASWKKVKSGDLSGARQMLGLESPNEHLNL